mmetsp:Transcript_2173/g.3254  ORF Transcript_2173/g.3254 Transcript_2173/m.3254 type:complete len:339 (-) Transcript_2173:1169-2185(-)
MSISNHLPAVASSLINHNIRVGVVGFPAGVSPLVFRTKTTLACNLPLDQFWALFPVGLRRAGHEIQFPPLLAHELHGLDLLPLVLEALLLRRHSGLAAPPALRPPPALARGSLLLLPPLHVHGIDLHAVVLVAAAAALWGQGARALAPAGRDALGLQANAVQLGLHIFDLLLAPPPGQSRFVGALELTLLLGNLLLVADGLVQHLLLLVQIAAHVLLVQVFRGQLLFLSLQLLQLRRDIWVDVVGHVLAVQDLRLHVPPPLLALEVVVLAEVAAVHAGAAVLQLQVLLGLPLGRLVGVHAVLRGEHALRDEGRAGAGVPRAGLRHRQPVHHVRHLLAR